MIDDGLREAYGAFRLRAVADVIERWRVEHGVEVDIFDPRPQVAEGSSTDAPAPSGEPIDAARRLLHAAIDRMPIEELNRVHIPVEYYVES
jgi:hypothetical protein